MKKLIKIFILTSIVFATSSCEKFLDVNDNPNSPVNENLTLASKLSAALATTASQETVQINQLSAFWSGYWGTTSEAVSLFAKEKTYSGVQIRGSRDGIQVWENSYNILLYYQLIKEQAEKENALYYIGIAKIMQGWHFLRLVDIYNNIPFDEALKGTSLPRPKYEDGETVYSKSLNLISEGINDIKSAPAVSAPGNDDILFKGNSALWYKFANTIKLRALLRQTETDNQPYINSELAKIQMEGSGFLGSGQNAYAQPGYLNTNGKINPFYENFYRNVGGAVINYANIRPTQYVIDQYTALSDPRLVKLYVPANGTYKGVLFGNPTSEDQYKAVNTSPFRGPVENANAPAALFKNYNQPSVLLSSFESLFLQAEATERGWLSAATAKNLYEEAIKESFKYMEVAAADFALYNLQTTVNYDLATNKIERIINQKWLALNSISSFEAWSDYRRLGFPNIPNSLQAPGTGVRPLRLMYPETEHQTNKDEVNKQGNDDILTSPIWWDK